jgi:L,D-transpeptidase catalytic domain
VSVRIYRSNSPLTSLCFLFALFPTRPGGLKLSINGARRARQQKSAAGVCACGLGAALTVILAGTPALARSRYLFVHRDLSHRDAAAQPASKEPFGDIPKGPLQIYVSIDQQKLHLYSDGAHVADTSVATGVPNLPTPLGVFSVIQKQRYHESNIYSNAPMPFMQRITWSGVALHEGENIGHRASHGCIRMPHDFAVRLFSLTRIGVPVVIADGELKPVEFADPHLFVHKDRPPPPPPSPAPAVAVTPPADTAVQTAQTAPATAGDGGKTTEAAASATSIAVKPDQIGLRVDASPPNGTPVPPAAPPAATAATSLAITSPPVTPPAATPAAATLADAVAEPAAPPAKPADMLPDLPSKKTPIAIFISRKEKKIYVRQDFEPLFAAAITIAHPDQLLGTHVFTALDFLGDHATLRWNVVSLPGEPPPPARVRNAQHDKRAEKRGPAADLPMPPPQTPAEVLARIDIPRNVIDYISQLMVPGSSLVVSDHGLGDETGDGTDFIVVTQ